MESTPSLEATVREGLAKLEHVFDRIERCEVVIDRPHRHHHNGQRIRVRVLLGVPGPDIVVDEAHEDAYTAIREAFRIARRQIEDHAHVLRREVKQHSQPRG